MKIVLNKEKLDEIERQVPGAKRALVRKTAQDTEAYVKSHFSDQSPSEPGHPPGVDTGTMKNNTVAREVNDSTWELIIGTEYAAHLEYGTTTEDGAERMAPRPFLLPAVEHIAGNIPPELLREVVEG